MVEVHLVGGAVPRVVRPAVDVEQQRQRALALGVADQPALHLGAVGDREVALLADEQLDVGEAAPCSVSTVSAPVARSSATISPNDVGRGERDDGGAARDREPGDDAAVAAEDAGRPGVPEVRAAAVADREQQPAVGGLDRARTRVGRAAGHHVAVEVTREVDGLAAVERDPQQAGVPEPQCPGSRRPAGSRRRR